jgi:hypothetical protein
MKTEFSSDKPEMKGPFGGLRGRKALKWVLKKQDVRVWIEFICSEQGLVGCFCECGNETLGSIKNMKFLHQLSYYQLLMSDHAS